jgi:anti-anti-sigma factor
MRVAGELDIWAAPQLIEVGVPIVRDGGVAVDCADLTFIDAAGIGALVRLAREARPRRLTLLGLSPHCRMVLRVASADGVFDLAD